MGLRDTIKSTLSSPSVFLAEFRAVLLEWYDDVFRQVDGIHDRINSANHAIDAVNRRIDDAQYGDRLQKMAKRLAALENLVKRNGYVIVDEASEVDWKNLAASYNEAWRPFLTVAELKKDRRVCVSRRALVLDDNAKLAEDQRTGKLYAWNWVTQDWVPSKRRLSDRRVGKSDRRIKDEPRLFDRRK